MNPASCKPKPCMPSASISHYFATLLPLQLNLSDNNIRAEGAQPLADALRVNASLTALDVRHNTVRDEGKALLQQAVQGRSGFDLKM